MKTLKIGIIPCSQRLSISARFLGDLNSEHLSWPSRVSFHANKESTTRRSKRIAFKSFIPIHSKGKDPFGLRRLIISPTILREKEDLIANVMLLMHRGVYYNIELERLDYYSIINFPKMPKSNDSKMIKSGIVVIIKKLVFRND